MSPSRRRPAARTASLVLALVLAGLCPGGSPAARAHCDTLTGPVVQAARTALERGDVTPVLPWVKAEHEAEIRTAFRQTLVVRALGAEARALADRYFYETLVRIHRAGEGAPYTGLKDQPAEPIIALADQALADGSAEAMIQRITAHVAAGIQKHFDRAAGARRRQGESVSAGREFVDAYVRYTHYVEGIHAAVMAPGTDQAKAEPGPTAHAEHAH